MKSIIRDMPRAPARPREEDAVKPGWSVATARAQLSSLAGLPQVLEKLGVAPEPLLKSAGLSAGDLTNPQRSATFAEMDRLIGVCRKQSRCEHLGLLLGQHVDLRAFGIAGRLAANSPTVGDALHDLARHFVLHDSGGSLSVAIREDRATLSYGIHAPGVRNTDQVYDLAVAAMCNVMRQLCGAEWTPGMVLLPRKRPPSIEHYRQLLRAPLRFDSLQAGVVFPATWLTRTVERADPLLHEILRSRAAMDVTGRDPLLYGDARRAIRELLPTGKCSRLTVAQRLGLHERTLGRRLQAAGTTFQELLDAVRAEQARQLLHDTRMPVARVAASLGFGDSTVFARAFRRWSGLTPREFRAQARLPPAQSRATR
jgi:AraC-like DNA-binding protein